MNALAYQNASKPTIRVSLKMHAEEHGGRHGPFTEGYRPYLKIGDGDLMAVTIVNCPSLIAPGDQAEVEIAFDYPETVDYSRLVEGAEFEVCEGPRSVACGKVMKRSNSSL